jgi:hypothetical protein
MSKEEGGFGETIKETHVAAHDYRGEIEGADIISLLIQAARSRLSHFYVI